MKKTMTLILCLTLVLALCACGSPESEPAASQAAPVPAATEEPGSDDLPLGSFTAVGNGTRYENRDLGFACELDENWYVYSEEEMAQMAGFTEEQFTGTDYEELMKNADTFFVLYAARTDGTATINLNLTYVGSTDGVDMDKYLDMILPQLKDVLEAGGMTDVRVETNTLDFAGSQHKGILIYAKSQGVDYYAQQIYYMVGPRLAVLTMGTFLEDNTAELVELFTAAD